jgi:hypothetical protein
MYSRLGSQSHFFPMTHFITVLDGGMIDKGGRSLLKEVEAPFLPDGKSKEVKKTSPWKLWLTIENGWWY